MDSLTREAEHAKTDVKVPFSVMNFQVKYCAQQLRSLFSKDAGVISVDMKVWADGCVIATFEDKNGVHVFRTEDLKNEDDSESRV
jgi:hypothetical protein